MKKTKDENSQNNFEKEEWNGMEGRKEDFRNRATWFEDFLWTYSNRDSVGLAEGRMDQWRDTENLEIDAHRQSQWIILANLQKQLYKGRSPQQMTVDQLDICIN